MVVGRKGLTGLRSRCDQEIDPRPAVYLVLTVESTSRIGLQLFVVIIYENQN